MLRTYDLVYDRSDLRHFSSISRIAGKHYVVRHQSWRTCDRRYSITTIDANYTNYTTLPSIPSTLCRHQHAADAIHTQPTHGVRLFPVAAARAWNSSSSQTTAISSLLTFIIIIETIRPDHSKPFVQFPALLRGVISDLLTRRLCWCRQLAVRHWVTARFRRLQQRAWNSLPRHVRDMPSLLAFSRKLKTVLFRLSYPVD